MKFKKPTLSQIIVFSIVLLLFSVSVYMFAGSIKTILSLSLLGFIIWSSYRLYKSTPQERIRWGKKNKFLGLFFKENSSE